MPRAQWITVILRLDGQAKRAREFTYTSEALAWAEDQRQIHLAE